MNKNQNTSSIESVTTIDAIRFSKLLEQIQYALITFIIAFFVGSMTDKLFPIGENTKEITNFQIWRDVLIQLSVNVITAYYIMKIATMVPFVFSLSKDYIISGHGESLSGAGLAMAIVFISVQNNFKKRISILKERYYP